MLIHKGTVTLTTERLILRRFTIEDDISMFNNWANDDDVAKYMRWDAHKDISETRDVLSKRIEKYSDLKTYIWAIVLKSIDEPIGSIGLMILNEYDMCADAAYCIGKSYWGNGYAAEALREVIRFGLLEINFNRIEAYHSINNMASGKVMQNAGMQFEGRMRQKYKSHYGFEDSDMYAVLKQDLIQAG